MTPTDLAELVQNDLVRDSCLAGSFVWGFCKVRGRIEWERAAESGMCSSLAFCDKVVPSWTIGSGG